MKTILKAIQVLFTICLLLTPLVTLGQRAYAEKEALEQQTKTCPDGQYAGRSSSNRGRYVKDNYIWAVTREYAKRFCMPSEFIVDDLKGAEAIAYWHGKPTGQESCEIKDGREVCELSRHGHWLEIYVKTGSIPKYDPEVAFYVRDYRTSANVLGTASRENSITKAKNDSDARKRGEVLEPPGKRRPYFGIGPMADGKRIVFNYLARTEHTRVDVRAAALSEHYFVQNIYQDLDLIALEGWSWGAIAGKDFPVEPQYGYAIGIRREGNEEAKLAYPKAYFHVIELPQRIVRVLNAADRGGSQAFEDAVRQLTNSPPKAR